MSSLQLMTSDITGSHCPLDAMKQHENSSNSTDTRPNSRVKRRPLSAPLGPCPIPAPPHPSVSSTLPQGPGLPCRPLPSDTCRQRLWLPRTVPRLSAVTHPPLDRPLSPASPPMGSSPRLHSPAGCPRLTRAQPPLPTGTRPWTGLCVQHHLPWGATPASTHPPAAPA